MVYLVSLDKTIIAKKAEVNNRVRPVIHLDKDIAVSSGKGTLKNPYVIS